MNVLQRNNVKITGSKSAPIIMYAHGFGCSQAMWAAVTPELLSVKLGQLLSQLPTTNRYQRILHIEDDQDIVTIMRMQLENLCDYQAVASLVQAKKILQQHRFDLILLDLGLPDGNGIDVLPDIAATQGDIPVVIFSAQDLSAEHKAKVPAVYSKSRINTEVLAKYLKNILN